MLLGCCELRRDAFYGMEGREAEGWRGRCCGEEGGGWGMGAPQPSGCEVREKRARMFWGCDVGCEHGGQGAVCLVRCVAVHKKF